MLPVVEPEGRRTCRHIIAFSVLLIGASALPAILGLTGKVYLYGAVLMGLGLLGAGISLTLTRSELDARRLLKASVVYLPLLFLLCAVDTGF